MHDFRFNVKILRMPLAAPEPGGCRRIRAPAGRHRRGAADTVRNGAEGGHGGPDQGIPSDLLKAAQCVVIVPGLKKVGLVVGGKYGRGFLVCRSPETGASGAPAALRIEGGSVGFQIRASETDVIMLLMDQRSVKGILNSRFTLGGDADVAAGPVGRSGTAQTDATMNAKILSYSRSRGVFAGLALSGATLRQDLDENNELYGRKVSTKEIVAGQVPAPAAASELIDLLKNYSQR